jgi:NAD(P)-dependent dehydrogenase (short-subunit alcohol dehydrogenase family)
MPWSTADIPDLSHHVAVVTGANSGLGLESAKALAGAGAHVVMAARNQEKAHAAHDEILAAHPEASLEIVELDLGSLESVRAAATTISDHHPTVDILLNNAGLMAMPERRTADGFEMQLGVNHFGHWVLTAELLGSLLAAEAARVVTVTSTAHHMGRPIDPDDVNLEDSYSPWGAYGRAKLANYHFGLGLDRAFRRRGLAAESLVAHPGLSHTALQVRTHREGGAGFGGAVAQWMAARTGMPADRGALPQLRAATDPRARGGEFYGPRWGNFGHPVRLPVLRPSLDRDIATLWSVSERETGVTFDFDAAREDA